MFYVYHYKLYLIHTNILFTHQQLIAFILYRWNKYIGISNTYYMKMWYKISHKLSWSYFNVKISITLSHNFYYEH